MNRSLSLLAALAFTLAACDGLTAPDLAGAPAEPTHARSAPTITLVLGETSLLGTGSHLAFDAVVSDNRCAADVVCVQAGEARTRFTLHAADGTAHPVALTIPGGHLDALPIQDAPWAVAGGHIVYLLRLQPYPGYAPDEGMPVTATLVVGQCRNGCAGTHPPTDG